MKELNGVTKKIKLIGERLHGFYRTVDSLGADMMEEILDGSSSRSIKAKLKAIYEYICDKQVQIILVPIE